MPSAHLGVPRAGGRRGWPGTGPGAALAPAPTHVPGALGLPGSSCSCLPAPGLREGLWGGVVVTLVVAWWWPEATCGAVHPGTPWPCWVQLLQPLLQLHVANLWPVPVSPGSLLRMRMGALRFRNPPQSPWGLPNPPIPACHQPLMCSSSRRAGRTSSQPADVPDIPTPCPATNYPAGQVITPLGRLDGAGVRVGLGSDDAGHLGTRAPKAPSSPRGFGEVGGVLGALPGACPPRGVQSSLCGVLGAAP